MSDVGAELDVFVRRFPVARGRLAQELLGAALAQIDQTGRLVEERAGRSVIRRLAAAARHRNRAEEIKIQRDLLRNQQALTVQAEALLRHAMAVDADIALVAGFLRRAQHVAAHAEDSALRAQAGLAGLADAVAGLSAYVIDMETRLDGRIDALQRQIDRLDQRVEQLEADSAAPHALKAAVKGWQAGRTYPGLPWACQMMLLAQEVFNGPCGMYELLTGDTRRYRDELAAAVHISGREGWADHQPRAQILASTAAAIGGGDTATLVAELLGAWVASVLQDKPRGPLVGGLRDLLGLEPAMVDLPAAEAILQTGTSWVPPRMTGSGYLRQVIDEQADTALLIRRGLRPLYARAQGPDNKAR